MRYNVNMLCPLMPTTSSVKFCNYGVFINTMICIGQHKGQKLPEEPLPPFVTVNHDASSREYDVCKRTITCSFWKTPYKQTRKKEYTQTFVYAEMRVFVPYSCMESLQAELRMADSQLRAVVEFNTI
jgi:hypothetical protein